MSTLQTTNLKNPSSGSNNIVLATDGSTTITTLNGTTITGTSVRGVITSGTAVASTSGTSIDFTGIPSWVKRVTVMFNGVSTNGTSFYLVQIGAGSVTTTGYLSNHAYVNNAANSCTAASSTQGFLVAHDVGAASIYGGICTLATLGSNVWTASGTMNRGSTGTGFFAGTLTLSGTLDRIRITTVNGTDTFDAGSINILYEG